VDACASVGFIKFSFKIGKRSQSYNFDVGLLHPKFGMERRATRFFIIDEEESTLKETEETKFSVTLLPVGSTEAYGRRAPSDSDPFQGVAIAKLVCAIAW
jgi:hypothetical protein